MGARDLPKTVTVGRNGVDQGAACEINQAGGAGMRRPLAGNERMDRRLRLPPADGSEGDLSAIPFEEARAHFLGVLPPVRQGGAAWTMLAEARMNERTLLALGVLLGVGSGKPPEQWLQSAHEFAREKQAADPMNGAVLTVLAGAAAFFAAERGHNPKVKSFYDALVYVSSSISVGYSEIFAQTSAGKAIGAAVMTYGPALAARVFDVPHEARDRVADGERSEAALRGIADKLQHILVELQRQRSGTSQHG